MKGECFLSNSSCNELRKSSFKDLLNQPRQRQQFDSDD